MWYLRIVSANTRSAMSVLWAPQAYPHQLNFKDPEPEAEELTADRVVAAKQNTVWSWAMQQRSAQRLWELWCESAEAYLHKRTKQGFGTVKAQTGRGQVHRTRSSTCLLHRNVALVGGLSVVPWSMLRLWEKVKKSGEGLLSETRWGVARQHHFPSRESLGIQP